MFEITRTHRGYTVQTDQPNDEMLSWVVACYGFLLEYHETLTGAQFAQRIERHYCLKEPHNRAAFDYVSAA